MFAVNVLPQPASVAAYSVMTAYSVSVALVYASEDLGKLKWRNVKNYLGLDSIISNANKSLTSLLSFLLENVQNIQVAAFCFEAGNDCHFHRLK